MRILYLGELTVMAKKSFAEFMNTFMHAVKAVPESQFEDFVKDYTDDEHAVPTKEEIQTGSPQAASGGGAAAMVAQYSNPAPQQGITEEYIRFNRTLEGIGKAVATQGKVLAALTAYVKSTETAPATSDESLVAKADLSLTKARKILIKAEMDDDEENDEKEESVTRAEKALSVAKTAILKAEEEGEDDEKVEKARDLYKSLVRRTKDLRTTIKAKGKDAGNQADHADPATGNQDDAAAKARETQAAETAKAIEAAVQAALEKHGIGKAAEPAAVPGDGVSKAELTAALQPHTMALREMMEVIAGQSKNIPPNLQKADMKALVKARVDKVREALDNGGLGEMDEMRATNILGHLHAAQEGKLDMNVVLGEIAKSSYSVQELFSQVA